MGNLDTKLPSGVKIGENKKEKEREKEREKIRDGLCNLAASLSIYEMYCDNRDPNYSAEECKLARTAFYQQFLDLFMDMEETSTTTKTSE